MGDDAVRTSGVEHAETLVGFAERVVAAMSGDGERARELPDWRERVRRELGARGLVDASAVVANFERMVRIADGTGIPLDTPVRLMTGEMRADLGIDRFASARQTPPTGAAGRLLGRALRPLAIPLMRLLGRARRD